MADERDPKVSQRYRELPGEEPPRELDQHILAAAHRAAGRPHAPLVAPAGRHRWYYSLAAAAVLVLAVAVTLHVERQQPDPEAISSTAPVPPAAKEEMALQKPAERKPAEQKPARQEPASAPRPQAPPRFTPEPPPPSSPAARADALGAASAPAANATASRQVQDAQVERRAQSGAAPSLAARSAPAPASVQLMSAPADRAADTPERELERIVELRRSGRDDEADKALAEFRKRYPDYRISAETRAKVERPGPAR